MSTKIFKSYSIERSSSSEAMKKLIRSRKKLEAGAAELIRREAGAYAASA
jgi:hypothetical protein